jgi:phosphoglycerate dehydrogenase-like enzyme
MTAILIRDKLTSKELEELKEEFQHFSFWIEAERGPPSLADWAHIEVLYGARLSSLEFEHAPLLRWIHLPLQSVQGICTQDIERGGHILVSNTKEANVSQMAEFALAGILAFSKNLFGWQSEERDPKALWESPLRAEMSTLKHKTLLQIGLNGAGGEITRLLRELGMRTWGIGRLTGFHPHCDKTFKASDLHSLLPAADIISVCLPHGEEPSIPPLQRPQLELIKRGAILVVLGVGGFVDERVVAELAREGQFKGVVLDTFYHSPPPSDSPLWKCPNLLMTPEVATLPPSSKDLAYRTFRSNLRCFVHEDFDGMANLVYRVTGR